MQDVNTIRRINLSILMDEFSSQSEHATQAEFAKALETSASHLSQLKKGNRNIGNTFARKVEQRMQKPRGWMDAPQGWSKELIAAESVLPNMDDLKPEDLLLLRSVIERMLSSK